MMIAGCDVPTELCAGLCRVSFPELTLDAVTPVSQTHPQL